ncbi:MAG TPA: aminotransferase class I/II-fold pyridoxal phosphate-dependent enzyme, partial [Chitinophagales bacterium]|nr:aminotransferase class I/II-fold pyridoxal phosphate-dependent enzyme [Chitinophagales bacterium]
PAICSATIKSIELVKQNNEWRVQFHGAVKKLRALLADKKIPFHSNTSHVTAVHIGDNISCKAIADRLLNEFGVYLQPINPPTVKEGEACLRITVTAKHTEADMQQLVNALSIVMHETV